MRPRSIVLFERVYLASIVLGIVGLALSWNAVEQHARAQAGEAASMVGGVLVFGAVLGIALPLLLLYFIARRASNLAKWIFVALAAVSLYMFVSDFASGAARMDLLLVLSVVNMALTLFAAWLLFRTDAKAWLESRGAGGTG